MREQQDTSTYYKVNKKLEDIGQDLGRKLFDGLREERVGLKIQNERTHYSKQMAKTFKYIVVIYTIPIWYYLNEILLAVLKHPEAPDTLFYDLLYELPPFSFEMYGAAIVLGGSFLLATDLFDNFLTEEIEKGSVIATVHSGVIIAIIGFNFQMHNYYDIPISEPGIPHPVFDMTWTLITNFEYVLPFVVPLFLAGSIILSYRNTLANESNRCLQTRLDSDRWDT
ncbi:hypothetical protein [Halomarina pelagica]|uniref:hypothetical protein n=1 Tax=Halomarina pelagica TaxID=2961599 RepID=UPI0020C2B477|nr:hypothetical protein [Halomarina sp. BND7]